MIFRKQKLMKKPRSNKKTKKSDTGITFSPALSIKPEPAPSPEKNVPNVSINEPLKIENQKNVLTENSAEKKDKIIFYAGSIFAALIVFFTFVILFFYLKTL